MKENYPKIKLQRAKALLHLISRTWFPSLDWPTIFIENYFGHLESSFKNRGMKEGIAENKLLRLKYTQWLSQGLPFPTLLLKLGAKESKDVDSIRIVLSVLNVTRAFRLPIDPSLGVIEDLPRAISLNKFKEFLKVAIKPWMRRTIRSHWSEFHFSTKSGPNGQAMYTSFEDLSLLPPNLLEDIKTFGGHNMNTMLAKIFRVVDKSHGLTPFDWIRKCYVPKKTKNCIRRISFIPDREGKTRTIGVLDYWSQTVLKPLHDSIMLILKGLKADMTFRQEANLINKVGPYYSVDLKAATDSFPVSLQKAVLQELIGDKAEVWERIMTGYPFLVPNRSDPLFYKRGQPMGAYSSWAVFSLTHHLLIQFSAWEVKCYPFTDYQVLGDDVVIASEVVGRRYLHNLNAFDIPVSKEKTMVSKDTYEFAKRWFVDGIEVSPFPVNGLFEESKYYFTMTNLMKSVDRKGWPSFVNGSPNREFIMGVWDIFGKKSQKERLIKKLLVFNSLKDPKSRDLGDVLNELYPKVEPKPDIEHIKKHSKLLLSFHDLLQIQNFYNTELDELRSRTTFIDVRKTWFWNRALATPAYEYADVWPPLNVARRLINQYMSFLRILIGKNKGECQLADEAFQQALINNEVPSFVISRSVVSERTARKKLGATARLTGAVMSMWNGNEVKGINVTYLEQKFRVFVELDFDEWDNSLGRIVIEPKVRPPLGTHYDGSKTNA